MAPALFNLKELRRRSRASFRTERSTDTSSDGSTGNTPTSGSLTPPSIAHQSDPALNLQLKESPPVRPALSTNRYSVSGMAGLGSPVVGGKSSLPVSQYAPRIANVAENSWVSYTLARPPRLDSMARGGQCYTSPSP